MAHKLLGQREKKCLSGAIQAVRLNLNAIEPRKAARTGRAVQIGKNAPGNKAAGNPFQRLAGKNMGINRRKEIEEKME